MPRGRELAFSEVLPECRSEEFPVPIKLGNDKNYRLASRLPERVTQLRHRVVRC
jgi:hypothetical protein